MMTGASFFGRGVFVAPPGVGALHNHGRIQVWRCDRLTATVRVEGMRTFIGEQEGWGSAAVDNGISTIRVVVSVKE
jgi:hypothetical protein